MADHARPTAALGASGTATARGLRLRDGLTFEDWVGAGRQISKISSASAWWLGDWLLYGEQAYGRRYRAALELTPFDYKTLRNYAWVARRFAMSRRRDSLSFQHHAEVASLTDPEQDLWLKRAEALRWSRNELRRQLAVMRRRDRGLAPRDAILLRIRVDADRERQWREAADATRQPLADWIAAAADEAAQALLVPRASVIPSARASARRRRRGQARRRLP
jgi:hypothetical protein